MDVDRDAALKRESSVIMAPAHMSGVGLQKFSGSHAPNIGPSFPSILGALDTGVGEESQEAKRLRIADGVSSMPLIPPAGMAPNPNGDGAPDMQVFMATLMESNQRLVNQMMLNLAEMNRETMMSMASIFARGPPQPAETPVVGAVQSAGGGPQVIAPTLLDPASPDIVPSSVLQKKLAVHLDKSIKKTGLRFKDNVHKYVNMKVTVKKARRDLEILKDRTAGKSRYPAGTKPWRSPLQLVELDEVMPECLEEDHKVIFTIPRDTRLRDAMLHVHHGMTVFTKDLLLGSLEKHWLGLKAKTTRQFLWESCRAACADSPDLENLGFENPKLPEPDPAVLNKKIEEIYATVVQEVRGEVTCKIKNVEEKQKRDKELKEAAANESPSTMLEALVSAIVKAEIQTSDGADVDGDAILDGTKVEADEPDSKVVRGKFDALFRRGPKNGSIPGGAWGSAKNLKDVPDSNVVVVEEDAAAARTALVPSQYRRGKGSSWNPRKNLTPWAKQRSEWWRQEGLIDPRLNQPRWAMDTKTKKRADKLEAAKGSKGGGKGSNAGKGKGQFMKW